MNGVLSGIRVKIAPFHPSNFEEYFTCLSTKNTIGSNEKAHIKQRIAANTTGCKNLKLSIAKMYQSPHMTCEITSAMCIASCKNNGTGASTLVMCSIILAEKSLSLYTGTRNYND